MIEPKHKHHLPPELNIEPIKPETMKKAELKLRGRQKQAFEMLVDFENNDNYACSICKKNWVSVKKGKKANESFLTCCNETMVELTSD